MLLETARNNGFFEFVLIDLGPSSGYLNRVFVMSSDYILPMALADRMSLCSTDGLLYTVLPIWMEWFADIKALDARRDADEDAFTRSFKFGDRAPRILPIIVTKLQNQSDDGGGKSTQKA